MKIKLLTLVLVFTLSFAVKSEANTTDECVVLLHGLARVSNSMGKLESRLQKAGFSVANVNYPSRKSPVAELAEDAVGRGIAQCNSQTGQPAHRIHFVTHSLGGILLRYYASRHKLENQGRVVMLGPPNQGSEVVDRIGRMPGFKLLGNAALSLGTDANSIPRQLGPVDFELGVIAGSFSLVPLSLFLPNPDDGLVSVASTKVKGMSAHIVLPVSHTLMMRNNAVIEQTIHFLYTGKFIEQ